MRKLQWLRVSRMLVAFTLVFALGSSTIFTGQQVKAAPIDDIAWEKISTSELESAIGSYGTTYSIVEYKGVVYAGGLADSGGTGHYAATVYAKTTNGNWELVSPDLGAGEDSSVTHMVIFQGKLYVAVDASGQEPLKLWIYDGDTDTWSLDESFTLNDERVANYVTQVVGVGIVGGNKLCATTLDQGQAAGIAVMCTNGTGDWFQLPNIGLETALSTSNYFTNILTTPDSDSVAIVVNYDIGGGDKTSIIAFYQDVDDLDGYWSSPFSQNFGPDRVVSAMNMFVSGQMGLLMVAVADALGATNVELREAITVGAEIPLDETLRASLFIDMHEIGDNQARLIITGTNSNDMAVVKYLDSYSPNWHTIGPTVEQVGPDGENPAEYVTALTVQDDSDMFLGLQGNASENGNGTIWYYDAPNEENDVPSGGSDNDGGDTTPKSTPASITTQANDLISLVSSTPAGEGDEPTAMDNDGNSNQADSGDNGQDDHGSANTSPNILWWLLALPIAALLGWFVTAIRKK